MEKWVLYAFISMFFAGFTSVIAKMGLAGITGELGLTIRTLFVCAFVLIFAAWAVPVQQLAEVSQRNLLWLGLSGITTALSWIFYYKASRSGTWRRWR
nr:EamA family transporter [Pseudomonas sp. s4]